MHAHRHDGTLHFLSLTLTAPETEHLAEQIDVLIANAGRLRRARHAGQLLLLGLAWNIELERGLSGMWRPHMHALAAVGSPAWSLQKEILTRWVGLFFPRASTSTRQSWFEHQHSVSLNAHEETLRLNSDLSHALFRDGFKLTAYATKQGRMSLSDRLTAYEALQNRRLSSTSGVFYGIAREELRAIGSTLTPLLRKQARTRVTKVSRLKAKVVARTQWLQKARSSSGCTETPRPTSNGSSLKQRLMNGPLYKTRRRAPPM